MISDRASVLLQIFLLAYLLHTSCALQCKTCDKVDPACLLAQDIKIHDCINDADLCYTWFDRTKGHIGVQRGCISSETAEYKTIKNLMNDKDKACVKRVNGLDCFEFCSNDNCN